MSDLVHWHAAPWRKIPGLRHGFLGRCGGVSRGPFASLNVSALAGDDAGAVRENRRRLRAVLGPLRLALPVQVHGHGIRIAGAGLEDLGEADAVITGDVGVAIGVLTADCVPVLLVAPQEHAVAVVHAGWRGTALDILGRTLDRLRAECGVEPEGVHAALGPAIGACCYQVGEEVVAAIRAGTGLNPETAQGRDEGGVKLDLRQVNAAVLRRAGIPEDQIAVVGPCTACAAATCFSHRRAGGATGRQLSFIGWAG